jgi:hypothetical protein
VSVRRPRSSGQLAAPSVADGRGRRAIDKVASAQWGEKIGPWLSRIPSGGDAPCMHACAAARERHNPRPAWRTARHARSQLSARCRRRPGESFV